MSVDVYADFGAFLEALAAWIKLRRRHAQRTGLAYEVIRQQDDAKKVWVGVGVYTVCEIFFIAGKLSDVFACCRSADILLCVGLSIFLTEKEVFDSPSRTARLANAFWQFAYNAQDLYMCVYKLSLLYLYPVPHSSHVQFSEVISPCLVDGVLAPSQDQRGRLYSPYLYVFKKQRVQISTRMAGLVDSYEVSAAPPLRL